MSVMVRIDPLLLDVIMMQKQSIQQDPNYERMYGTTAKITNKEASKVVASKCIKYWAEMKIPLDMAMSIIVNSKMRGRRSV